MSDLLHEAAGALREAAQPRGPVRGDEALARVLRDVRRGQRRRRLAGLVVLQLAFVVTTVGAWAATTGRLAATARRVWSSPAPQPAPAERDPGPAAPEIVPLVPAAAGDPAAEPPAPARPAAERRTHVLEPRADEPTAAPSVSTDALYRDAHEAHFVRRDFAAALALWDRYLAVSPIPPFAVEARYNRAIALLRLGRLDEGARALRPFADGDYGSYRAAEARALLGEAERPR